MNSLEASTPLLTTKEAARLLNVTTQTIRHYIREETIHAVKLPSSGRKPVYRIAQSEIHRVMGA